MNKGFFIGMILIILIGIVYFINSKNQKNTNINDNEPVTNQTKSSNNKATGNNVKKNTAVVDKQDKNNEDLSINVNSPKNEIIVGQAIKKDNPQNIKAGFESIQKPENKDSGKKYNVELTLIDDEQNKLLVEYTLEAKLSFYDYKAKNKDIGSFGKVITDNSGKIFLTTTHLGSNQLQILTKNYAVFLLDINVRKSNNNIKIRLIKGGLLKIHATNERNKIIENLNVSASYYYGRYQIECSMVFDPAKRVYFIDNLPNSKLSITFNAKGCQEARFDNIYVDALQILSLEVKLNSSRILYFEIENKSKPDSILISAIYEKDGNSNGVKPAKVNALKNKTHLYEFELVNQDISSVILIAGNYAPLEVKLIPNQDNYKINLREGFKYEIIIKDAGGTPIPNLNVNYFIDAFNNEVKTNEKGMAIINGLGDNANILISIYQKGFKHFSDKWLFNSQNDKTRTIVMLSAREISGKVKFGELGINGATVLLEQKNATMMSTIIELSDDVGNYELEIPGSNSGSIQIKAFHPDYGMSNAIPVKWDGQPLVFDLILLKEKNISKLKLVDEIGVPLSGKKIILNIKDHAIGDIVSEIITTNERGECELHDLIQNKYYFILDDEKYFLKKSSSIEMPKEEIVLTAAKKDLRKLIVLDPENNNYNGTLRCSLEQNKRIISIDVFTNADGIRYLDFSFLFMDDNSKSISLIFEAPGYFSTRFGPYEKVEDYPNEFKIILSKSQNIKLKIVSAKDNLPIPFPLLYINNKGSIDIKTFQADETGEVFVGFLNGKFNVEASVEGYATFRNEFDCNDGKDFLIKLSKGGSLKGHLTISGKESASVHINPTNKSMKIDVEGNFEFSGLMAGEYTLSLNKCLENNACNEIPIPGIFIIENDKNCEVSLDDYLKKLTSLDVTIYKDGLLSNESGRLSIDRDYYSIDYDSNIKDGNQLFDMILPGRRELTYQYQEKYLAINVDIISNQKNAVELLLPCANLIVVAKNEEGILLSNILVRLNFGEKYLSEEQLNTAIIQKDSVCFNLFPKHNHCLLIEGDSSTNFELAVITPINLEVNQQQQLEVKLYTARKLPNIQIVDSIGTPLENVSFAIIDEKANFLRRSNNDKKGFRPFTNKNGFLPENGWPKSKFTLIVSKKGYAFQEVVINPDIDPDQVLQIKLQKPASIKCSLPQNLDFPISLGILRSNGELLKKPIDYNANTSTTFFLDISKGNVTFQDLRVDTYYIGYFWNGATTKLISKQGPFLLNAGQNMEVISNFVINQ